MILLYKMLLSRDIVQELVSRGDKLVDQLILLGLESTGFHLLYKPDHGDLARQVQGPDHRIFDDQLHVTLYKSLRELIKCRSKLFFSFKNST